MELFYAGQANREKMGGRFRLFPDFQHSPQPALAGNFLAGLQCGYTGRGTVPRVATFK
jgi:hypothetical protein